MYDKKLSEIFHRRNSNGQLQDDDGYPWAFRPTSHKAKKKTKIFYAIGDSWIDSSYFTRVFDNHYPEYLLINRAMAGNSNSKIINILEQDIMFLKTLNLDVSFLVSFSEVGRSLQDFGYERPTSYNNSHQYFGEILRRQYQSVKKTLGGYNAYVTTAFISNNFNSQVSIVDCCGPSQQAKPMDVFAVTSNGIFEYIKARNEVFGFDFVGDLEKSLMLKNFLESHDSIDDTLHINCYKPYEDFLENVFLNLQNNKNML